MSFSSNNFSNDYKNDRRVVVVVEYIQKREHSQSCNNMGNESVNNGD